MKIPIGTPRNAITRIVRNNEVLNLYMYMRLHLDKVE